MFLRNTPRDLAKVYYLDSFPIYDTADVSI